MSEENYSLVSVYRSLGGHRATHLSQRETRAENHRLQKGSQGQRLTVWNAQSLTVKGYLRQVNTESCSHGPQIECQGTQSNGTIVRKIL